MKETEEDTNKWKGIPCQRLKKINIIKMLGQPQNLVVKRTRCYIADYSSNPVPGSLKNNWGATCICPKWNRDCGVTMLYRVGTFSPLHPKRAHAHWQLEKKSQYRLSCGATGSRVPQHNSGPYKKT